MRRLRGWMMRFAGLFDKARKDREFQEELESHIQMHIEDNLRSGMTPAEARRQAMIQLGGIESTKEAYREQRGLPLLETLSQDLRYGARTLRKNPGFTAVAVLTLALGIGVNTALFSVVNAVLFRPLPYPDANQLVEIDASNLKDPAFAEYTVSGPDFRDWQATSRSFGGLGIYEWSQFWLIEGEQLRQVRGRYASASLFPTLGVQPILGRGFVPEDEKSGGVVVLGYELWQRLFGSETNLAGKTIMVNDQRQAIVGVMPKSFGTFPGRVELWAPMSDQHDLMVQRGLRLGQVIGRLRPGVSVRQAQAEMEVIARQLARQYPGENKDWGVRVASWHDKQIRGIRPQLSLMLVVAVIILLIVCANLGNLLLSRAMTRQKELAIRAALGASRRRLIRQLLTESLLLSLFGGVAGLLAVIWSRGLCSTLVPHLPRFAVVKTDSTVWCFALLMVVLTGIFCGLIPAWRIAHTDPNQTLKEGGQRSSADRVGTWLRSVLVVSEVAMALVLLIGAGLALRSVHYLLHAGLQADPARVLVFQVSLPDVHYPAESPQRTQFFEQLLSKIQALPGVEAAGTADPTPYGGRMCVPVAVEGHPAEPDKPAPLTGLNMVSPDLFKTLGLRVQQGRGFTAEDRKGAPEVAVINETMARRCWPGENPIGKHLMGGSNDPGITVVGVVQDLRTGSVEASATPDLYRCSYQAPWFEGIMVRTSGDPMKLVPQLESLVRSLDKRVPVESAQTLDRLLNDDAADTRQLGELLSFFAGLAFTLAVVGIYGVIAYTTAQRTHEFGLRMALGAEKTDIASLVLTWGGKLALAGSALGLGLAWWLTRLMASLLEGVSPTDPAIFAVMPLVIVAVALLACWFPARRATRIDPMSALRYE